MIIFAYRMRNFMDRLNFAAIDIGSNAVRLLIKGFYPGESVSDLSKVFTAAIGTRYLYKRSYFYGEDRKIITSHACFFSADAGL